MGEGADCKRLVPTGLHVDRSAKLLQACHLGPGIACLPGLLTPPFPLPRLVCCSGGSRHCEASIAGAGGQRALHHLPRCRWAGWADAPLMKAMDTQRAADCGAGCSWEYSRLAFALDRWQLRRTRILPSQSDLDKAARAVVASSHRNAGQTCICTNRVLVHVSVVHPGLTSSAKKGARMAWAATPLA